MNAAPNTRETSDPLLSVQEVARHFGQATDATAELIGQGTLPAVDGGQLAQRGRYDIGIVRQSELNRLELKWSKRKSKRIDTDQPPGQHPAAVSAMTFIFALDEDRDDVVAALSTERTRSRTGSAKELRKLWKRRLGRETLRKAGLASGVYPFPGEKAAAILRLVENPAPYSYEITKPTPMNVVALLPLIEEDGIYRADLPLFERQADLAPHAGMIQTDPDD